MNYFEIHCHSDIERLLNGFSYFHDSCIKEIVYISGGYIEETGEMNPFDSIKSLIIIFQSQNSKYKNIEMKFDGVVQMNLVPRPDDYDNIIHNASLIRHDGLYYWAEWENFRPNDSKNNIGTWIASKKISWRVLEYSIGSRPIYYPYSY